MKLDDFYFYYYLPSPMVSTYSSFAASITMNLPEINLLVCLSLQPLIFLLLVFQSETKTLLNSLLAKLKGLTQRLRTSQMSGCTC
ncbi:hypothetical protein IQ240_13325 [Nodularia sp. LEGE 04288]|nr:hypothetical protein [Nodularia sp. LEGE 04288]